MSDIVEFIKARIDEDERAALAWLPLGNPDEAAREHIARHDPARVLAEVAAKRRMVQMYVNALHAKDAGSISAWNRAQDSAAVDVLGEVLIRLAMPHADHPDFDQAWAAGLYPTTETP